MMKLFKIGFSLMFCLSLAQVALGSQNSLKTIVMPAHELTTQFKRNIPEVIFYEPNMVIPGHHTKRPVTKLMFSIKFQEHGCINYGGLYSEPQTERVNQSTVHFFKVLQSVPTNPFVLCGQAFNWTEHTHTFYGFQVGDMINLNGYSFRLIHHEGAYEFYPYLEK